MRLVTVWTSGSERAYGAHMLGESSSGLAIIAIPLIGGLILYAVIHSGVRAPGNSLASKFQQLGVLQGRTKDQIVAAVGPPQAVSAQPGGKSLLQWQATGYHIALLFDGAGICEGITPFKVR
jgi:hypothetical protein